MGINQALEDVKNKETGEVPMHIRNAPAEGMEKEGYHVGYKYPHDYPGHYVEQQYLPDKMLGTKYFIKDENINLTILNEINKAAKMGMDSISYVLKKVGDENMKENLTFQYTEYGKIVDRVNNQFDKYGEIPDEAPVTDKMMAWIGTQMNTMTDKSNSKIAELMIQGGDMGIIKCQKLLNHNPRADEPVKNILNDFVTLQKNDIEQMKKFL